MITPGQDGVRVDLTGKRRRSGVASATVPPWTVADEDSTLNDSPGTDNDVLSRTAPGRRVAARRIGTNGTAVEIWCELSPPM